MLHYVILEIQFNLFLDASNNKIPAVPSNDEKKDKVSNRQMQYHPHPPKKKKTIKKIKNT